MRTLRFTESDSQWVGDGVDARYLARVLVEGVLYKWALAAQLYLGDRARHLVPQAHKLAMERTLDSMIDNLGDRARSDY